MPNPKLTIGGKKITFERPRKVTYGGDECYGEYNRTTRTIRVEKALTGLVELDTILHEFLHASAEFFNEEFVLEAAKEHAEALWKLGYRKLNPAQIKSLGLVDG